MVKCFSFILFLPIVGAVTTKLNNEDPLLLSPLLREGSHKEAQRLSRVKPDIGNTTSYSGYLTVDEQCESNLFFWFFPAQIQNWENAPLVLWLQGGPGVSSLFGLFQELGPFQLTKEGLKKRKYSWNNKNNLLFIDQPVGTGFSFSKAIDCYVKTQSEAGKALYKAIIQFYQLFPNFSKNKLIIAGESYAGHYIPALGHFIHHHNSTSSITINLHAMMIGNGLISAAHQSDYASFFYQLALIDDKGKEEFKKAQHQLNKYAESKDWFNATLAWTRIERVLFQKFVGRKVNRYNYLSHVQEDTRWIDFLKSTAVRRRLHTGDNHFQKSNRKVFVHMFEDIVQSASPWLEELLEFYPVVFYYGQLDLVCPYPLTEQFLRSLSWKQQDKYLNAARKKWCVEQDQAGYFKGEHHLYDVLVRGAGHMVPMDQPHWAYELVNSVTSGTPDNPLHALTTCD